VTTRSCKSFCPSLGRRSGLTGFYWNPPCSAQ
jgi:hypothetical protein